MRYIDTVQIATTTADGYGDKTVTLLTESKALFIQRTAVEHSNNMDNVISDATVYLDPTNDVVTSNLYRLEGMYIVAAQPQSAYGEQLFGSGPYGGGNNWYRITHVTVGQRKLLNNAIDNIYCSLEKQAGEAYVTAIG